MVHAARRVQSPTRNGGLMKKILVSCLLLIVGLIAACSNAPLRIGQTESAISEFACSWRAINAPNGAILASYNNACLGTSQSSADGTYGYANCTKGYIWEISNVTDTGVIPDRKMVVSVTPATIPNNQTDCQNSYVTMYLYGIDSVGNTYSADPICDGGGNHISAVAGTWSSPLSSCYWTNNTCTIDLDYWPDGLGGHISVTGFRAVGQDYLNATTNIQAVKETVAPIAADFSAYCLH